MQPKQGLTYAALDRLPIFPLALLGLFVLFIIHNFGPFLSESFSSLRKIPGPFAARFSRLWYLSTTATGQFHLRNIELHKKYGPIVRIAPKQYSINDPTALKQIYGIGNGFDKSRWYVASSIPHSTFKDLFTDLDKSRHAGNRRLVANLYSATSLRSMEPAVEDCIIAFKKKLRELSHSGTTMDVQFWMQCYAFDVITQITFNQRYGFLDTGSDEQGIFPSLHQYLKYCALVGIEHEWHETLWWVMTKMPASGMAHIGAFTAKMVAEGKRILEKIGPIEASQRQDFLSKTFQLAKTNPDKFPEGGIFTTCITNTGAGSDTTAISLSAVLDCIMTHPAALKKVRDEVDAKFEELGNPEFIPFTDTQKMPYLQACVKEALRLHPAVGLPLARQVPAGGATISGTYFPAGATVGVNCWVAHRNESVWGPSVDDYRPERWLTDDKQALSVMEASWMPFGAGSRTCIGKNISFLEINKLIPVLIRNFDFSIVNAHKQRHENFWLVKQVDLLFRVSERQLPQERE